MQNMRETPTETDCKFYRKPRTILAQHLAEGRIRKYEGKVNAGRVDIEGEDGEKKEVV